VPRACQAPSPRGHGRALDLEILDIVCYKAVRPLGVDLSAS
jgi:hypothetical protein